MPDGTPSRDRARLRRLAPLAIGVLALATGAAAALWWRQRALIYHPGGDAPPAGDVLPQAEELTVATEDGLDLQAWFVPPARGVDRDQAVLYLPGNGGDRSGRAGIATELSDRGFAVLLLDYRGFGGNPGRPSEEGLALDAAAGLAALRGRGYPAADVIYLGESLGTGVAARLQEREAPAGLLLRSPFTNLADVGQHHYPVLPVRALLRDEFPVAPLLQHSDVPVTVVYGDADGVVPPEQSAQVAAAAPGLVEELVLRGADHNDAVMFGPEVAEAAVRLAEEIR